MNKTATKERYKKGNGIENVENVANGIHICSSTTFNYSWIVTLFSLNLERKKKLITLLHFAISSNNLNHIASFMLLFEKKLYF